MADQTTAKTAITFDQFQQLDLRVATVTAAENHPNADRLIKVRLDDGTPEGRQVCAGIRQWYDAADLVGKQVVIAANLEPRTIRGEVSEGMVLAASHAPAPGETQERDVVLLVLDRPVPAGSPVS